MQVSVIIPVFNAEKQLKKCIASLLSQTLESCEFIFINDGSTDNSRSIIEDFQKQNGNIILINQENKGVSKARNRGLEIAKGNYIGFADADDEMQPDHFAALLRIAQETNADIVISKYIINQNGKQHISQTIFPENKMLDEHFIQKEILPHFIQTENLNAVWNKLYISELIRKKGIAFPVGVALGEDGWFNIHAFQKAKAVYFTDEAGYIYNETDGSATKDFKTKNYFDRILQEYKQDYSAFANRDLTLEKINELKAEKCISKSISLIHEYTHPKNKLGHKWVYKKLSEMIGNADFQKIIHDHFDRIFAQKNRYERFILGAIKYKWVSLLFIATAYSRFRNH